MFRVMNIVSHPRVLEAHHAAKARHETIYRVNRFNVDSKQWRARKPCRGNDARLCTPASMSVDVSTIGACNAHSRSLRDASTA